MNEKIIDLVKNVSNYTGKISVINVSKSFYEEMSNNFQQQMVDRCIVLHFVQEGSPELNGDIAFMCNDSVEDGTVKVNIEGKLKTIQI